jgi:hypothetical protein
MESGVTNLCRFSRGLGVGLVYCLNNSLVGYRVVAGHPLNASSIHSRELETGSLYWSSGA